MARDVHKQLELAEKLLGDIQHRWAGIPGTLRKQIRDYFGEHERSMLMHDHVAPALKPVRPVVIPRTKLQVLADTLDATVASDVNMEHLLRCAIIQVMDERAEQEAQREQAINEAAFSEY